ncbi:Hint domain-containing protein [Salibaculum griseiflavum]|nr:Hint domain-containing protein [Salibaculum griseiflavum]
MRRYEVVHLLSNGDIDEFNRIAPAIPAFEDGFASLARGCLLTTDRGTVAIEDILPGDKVKTVTNGFQTVRWRGSITIMPPKRASEETASTLTRISADALGIGRPMPDLLLGPSARLYHRTPAIERFTGHGAAFVPARDFIDGNVIFEVAPPSPVPVFQLGFARHERIVANGVELDSYNPGVRHTLGLRGDLLDLYLGLFPQVDSLDDFGLLLHPRMSLRDIDLFDVA